jgi:hypothetical protein
MVGQIWTAEFAVDDTSEKKIITCDKNKPVIAFS